MCGLRRPADATPTLQAAKQPAEEAAKTRANLIAAREALTLEGILAQAAKTAAIKSIDAKLQKLRQLEEQTTAATSMDTEDLLQRCNEAKTKVDEAEAHVVRLVDKSKAIEERIAGVQLDPASIERALGLAKQDT